MDWLKAIAGVVKTAAPVAANLVLPGSGALISGLMNEVIEQAMPDKPELLALPAEQKAAIIAKDPELLAQLESKALELEQTLAEEKTKNMKEVAETMKAELQGGNWWQKGWRPWNGYLFPLAVIGSYVVAPLYGVFPEIPAMLWVTWAGVLGVAVYGRNQEKLGDKSQATAGALKGIIKKLVG